MTLKELFEKRAALTPRIKEMADLIHAENRDFTAEEQKNWTAINIDYNVLTRRLELATRTEEIEAQQVQVVNNPGGLIGRADFDPGLIDAGDGVPGPRRAYSRGRFTGLNDLRIPEETRDLALRCWMGTQLGADMPEEWERAAFECRIRPEQPSIRVQLFDTGQFRGIPRWPNGQPRAEERALGVATATKGQEMVPEGFVPRLEKAMLAFGGMLQVSDVLRTDTGADLPWPRSDDTGNKGVLLAENTVVTEQDVAFAATTLGAFKYTSKLVKVAIELIQDSAISISELLGDMLGERLGRIFNEHFTTGTGSGQPNGIEVAAPIGITTAAVATFDADDLINMMHSVDPAYRVGARWLAHDSIMAVVRLFKEGGAATNQYLWQPGLQLGQPDRLLGFPITINQDMDSAIATGADAMIFGDLRKYKVRLVREIRLRRLVERFADADQEGFVAFARGDGDLLDAGTGPVKKLRIG